MTATTVLTSLTALVASQGLPAVIRAGAIGVVALTAARSKKRRRRRDAQETLRILMPPEPDEKPSSRGRKQAKGVRQRTPGGR
ncbi:hypothetical protein NE235_02450 [Actinoallomurus spadix]|uniref:Uncharacterized protein n=1 Tax=Actinoallomurus spadix TaxID=79912 RepID=A0ABN0XJS4_9ACTN|nr:hypothetical protein [Actinoallomurus spadix]MCO5984962.1 hypothetical protein [Actinoallomurus spadix]